MKAANSLEEERQALLDQIHTSRDTYRRMLHENEAAQSRPALAPVVVQPANRFPRSMTMRWITDHPYLVAGSLAGAALLAPRRVRSRISHSVESSMHKVVPYTRQAPKGKAKKAGQHAARGASGSMGAARKAFTGALTLAAMILKDPAKMRMATRAVTTAMEYMRQRRMQAQGMQGRTVRAQDIPGRTVRVRGPSQER